MFKKITIITLCLGVTLIFTGCQLIKENNIETGEGATIASTSENDNDMFKEYDEYFCPKNGEYNNSYSIDDNYKPDDTKECDTWNAEFWKKNSPNAYDNCIQKRKELKERFDKGYCDKFVIENFNYKSSKCKIMVSKKYKIIGSSECVGQDNDEARDEFKRRFKQN